MEFAKRSSLIQGKNREMRDIIGLGRPDQSSWEAILIVFGNKDDT